MFIQRGPVGVIHHKLRRIRGILQSPVPEFQGSTEGLIAGFAVLLRLGYPSAASGVPPDFGDIRKGLIFCEEG